MAVRLPKTREALKIYDATAPQRAALWEAVESNEDVAAVQAVDKAAADLVREAFAEDTKDINPRDRAFLVHPDDPWLRRIVEA